MEMSGSFTLYFQGKSLWYQLIGMLGGPQNRSGRGGEEEYPFLSPAGNRTPVVQRVA